MTRIAAGCKAPRANVKRMKTLQVCVAAACLLPCAGLLRATAQVPKGIASQVAVDPELARYIAGIKAIDNHAHTVLPPPNDATDREFDALPVDSMEPQTDPLALREDASQLPAAWQALWGFKAQAPLDAEGLKRLQAARAAVKTREGTNYDRWVLDRVGIGTEVSNRVAMGPGLERPRFAWVPYDDTLMFPLDNSALAASTPDKAQFFPLEARVMQRYQQAAGLQARPATLELYLQKLLLPTLRAQKAAGAIAIKFEVAYLRDFDFRRVQQGDAASVYAKFAGGGVPDVASYKLLQDFLFRTLCLEAGRLGMAVHIHTGEGAGSYFNLAGIDPMLLEPLFNDPELRKTTQFVMLHGSWPYVHEAGALLQKPNVYLDLSQQVVLFSPRLLSTWLREWLELYPDKVLFGTDAYPYSPAMGWEELLWIANRNAREAMGIALTGMLRDGVVDRPRAKAIADMVLRGNAARLYSLT